MNYYLPSPREMHENYYTKLRKSYRTHITRLSYVIKRTILPTILREMLKILSSNTPTQLLVQYINFILITSAEAETPASIYNMLQGRWKRA